MRTNLIRMLLVLLLALMGIGFVGTSTVQAQAYRDLTISWSNLSALQSIPDWAYCQGALPWSWGQKLNATWERNLYGYTQHADNYGNLWGQCVSSCKALSGSNVVTGEWMKGRRVTDGGIASGTVIATFLATGEKYSGHTAIFRKYIKDAAGRITGIEVWDQNWVSLPFICVSPTVFGKHIIPVDYGKAGVLNAANYFIVRVP